MEDCLLKLHLNICPLDVSRCFSSISLYSHVGTTSSQTCAGRQSAGRAAPVPTLPCRQLSYSGAACLAPGDPGRSQTPVPLLKTKKQWERSQRHNRKRYHESSREGNAISGLVTSSPIITLLFKHNKRMIRNNA